MIDFDDLRKRVEQTQVCMGMGGEERFVSHQDIVLPRKMILEMIDWVDTLRQQLKEADERAMIWRKELGDECDRLVIEWAEKVRELEEQVKETKLNSRMCGKTGCGKPATGDPVYGSLTYYTCDEHRAEIEKLVDNE